MTTGLSLRLTLRSPLADWAERNLDRTPEPVTMASPHQTPMRALSPVELATLTARVCPETTPTLPYSLLGEAALRLQMWQARGVLRYASADFLARYLQMCTSGPYQQPHPRRTPWAGLELIRQLDFYSDSTGIAVHLSAEPDAGNPLRFRRMRLHERIEEIKSAHLAKLIGRNGALNDGKARSGRL